MMRNLIFTGVLFFLYTVGFGQTVTFETDDGLTTKTICKGEGIQLNLSIDNPPRPNGSTSTYNVQWEKNTGSNFIKNCAFPSADGSCSFHREFPQTTTIYKVIVNGGPVGRIERTVTVMVDEVPNPGLNTTIFLCGKTGVINLFDELDGGPVLGGTWSNTTGTYDTSNPAGGAFTYTMTGNGACPEVSAVITVKPCGNNDTDGDTILNDMDNDNDNDGIPNDVEDGFCTTSTTTPIFVLEEDFGFGSPTRSKFAEGLGLAYNPVIPQDQGTNGEYNVATSSYFQSFPGVNGTFLATDLIGDVDANGDTDGRYLAINMKSSVFANKPVFVAKDLPVTTGLTYNFSMSIASLNNEVSEKPANLTIEVVDQATGVPIFSEDSGEIANGTDKWILVQNTFVAAPGVNVVTIRVINKQGVDGNGNDIGIDNVFLSTKACDFDRDGIPNSEDLDSDNDGIYDIVEAGNAAFDTDNDGRFDGPVGPDGSSATVTHNIINSDSDPNQDFLDIDSDGDGIIDNIEAQSTSGYIGPSGVDGDFNGVDDNYDTNRTAIKPINTNTTSSPDYIDDNSDPATGDCLIDTIEAYDVDQDGIADVLILNADTDSDGLDNAFDTVELDRLTGVTNATNGGTVPEDFPNNHNPLTQERDWREEMGADVDLGNLPITICDPINLFDELPPGTRTTGTWVVPTMGTELTAGHLGTLDPTATGVLNGPYAYVLPPLVASCPSIRYLINITIDDSCTCPDIEEPTNPSNARICEGSPAPVLSVDVLPGQTANWYDSNGVLMMENSTTYSPLDTLVDDYIYSVEAFDTTENCASDRIDVLFSIVNPPIIDSIAPGVICLGPSNVTTFLVDTELSNADFSFEWQLNGGLISGATQSSFLAFEPGIYSITYTDRITMCSNTIDVEVKGVSDPESLDLEVSNGSFANSQNIIANVVGDGEYEYSIDNSSFQESNIFNNVSLGLREISARDINGCGSITEEIFVFGFPSFFTPNNDGRNDTWNVVADDNLPEITIFIFDRYGKLLFQIDPGIGIDWDGTFNGIPMPATDYWFVARLADGSETYRGHFTLKR